MMQMVAEPNTAAEVAEVRYVLELGHFMVLAEAEAVVILAITAVLVVVGVFMTQPAVELVELHKQARQ